MKRASTRLGQQTLTLSLLSSLVLLAACGGGGNEPAAAAPAAVASTPVETPKIPDPTLTDVTAADEPYIVAFSSVEHDQSIDPVAPTFQLSILDGKTQTVLHKIAFAQSPAQKWLTVNKIERALKVLSDPDKADTNLPGTFVVETDKGPTHLYYIEANAVHHLDLSRRTEAKPTFTANQVSNLANACQLVDSYPLKQDGSSSALIVITAGADKDCDKTADNVRVLITSDDGADVAPRTPLLADAKLVKRIYNAGTLAGVLMQSPVPNTVRSQLSMLSPTLDTVLRAPVELPTGDPNVPVITNFLSNSPLGMEWLANTPGKDTGEGYLRLQGSTKAQIFKLIWDDAKQNFTTTLEQTFSGTQASVKSLNDGAYTYFAFNNIAYRGPVSGATKPFELIYNLGSLGLESMTSGLTPRYQTKTHVVYTQGEPTITSGWAVPKTPGTAYKLFQSVPQRGTPVQVVGQRGNTLVVLAKDNFDTVGMGVATLDIGSPDGENLTFAQVHNIDLIAPAWTATRVNGQAGVDSLIVQAKGGGAYNTVDLAGMKYGISLGEVDADLADSVKVVANQDGLASMNNKFDVTMELFGKVVTRKDPWLFNLGVKNSLLKIDTFAEDAGN